MFPSLLSFFVPQFKKRLLQWTWLNQLNKNETHPSQKKKKKKKKNSALHEPRKCTNKQNKCIAGHIHSTQMKRKQTAKHDWRGCNLRISSSTYVLKISSHGNKKVLDSFYHKKIFLTENEREVFLFSCDDFFICSIIIGQTCKLHDGIIHQPRNV